VPSTITGFTQQEKIANYATSMSESLASAFPGVGFLRDLVGVLKRSSDPADVGAATFFSNAKEFDILSTNLTSHIARNSQTAFSGVDATLQRAVTSRLATWQRLARVSTDFSTASTLMTSGLRSAYDIASMPRSSFVLRVAGSLGSTAAAERIHSRAQQIAGTAMGLFANMRQALTALPVRAIGDIQGSMRQFLSTSSPIANWQTLFGSQSYCECTDCRSVYSAAAYFVDLLQFLQYAAPNSAGQTPYQVLIARRPDLPYIKLRARKLIIVTNDARCVTLSVWAQQKNSSRNTACCFRT